MSSIFAEFESQLTDLYFTDSILAIVQGAHVSHICWVGVPVDLTIFYLKYPCNSSGSACLPYLLGWNPS